MSNLLVAEQVDAAVEKMVANGYAVLSDFEQAVRELVESAQGARYVARDEFRAQLKSDLQDRARAAHGPAQVIAWPERELLPTLFGAGVGSYPIRRVNFALSFLAHTAAVMLVAFSGMWLVQHKEIVRQNAVSLVTDISPYVLPSSNKRAGGGGGGGDRDMLAASKGAPPRFAREQIVPPAIVIRNSDPKLAVEASMVGPPNVTFPAAPVGDPIGIIGPPSNGVGSGGGIGSGGGSGVGSGNGAGVGPGYGGGFGGGVYRVGGGVSAPRAIYSPDPEYSEEARKAKYQGTVVLWAVIGPDGHPSSVRLARSLGMGLDQKAIDAVRQWKFEPAYKDGRPVAVQVNIEVNFRLY